MNKEYYQQQAEAFLDFQKRSNAKFDCWADSKDFSGRDKMKIFKEVCRIQTTGPEQLLSSFDTAI